MPNPQAEQLKEAGNASLKRGDIDAAISQYSQAISIEPDASYFRNRAMAYIKKKEYSLAAKDCKEGLRLDPNYTRCQVRLASVYLAVGNAALAVQTLQGVNDSTASTVMQSAQRVGSLVGKCNELAGELALFFKYEISFEI